jgi:CheY-like chemotaxis protein
LKPILIAEDDPSDLELLARLCKKVRILNPLHVVHDGRRAIDYLQGAREYSDRVRYPFPALLFLDLKMLVPGSEVLRWMRDHPVSESVAVVVMTDSANLRDINEAYKLGAHSFLMKPIAEEDLLNMIRYLKTIRTESGDGGRRIEVVAHSTEIVVPKSATQTRPQI